MRPTLTPILLILHLLAAPLAAQAGGVLRGVVLSEEGAPLAAASVAVLRGDDDTVIAGRLTGQDGRFRIDAIEPGSYSVRVTLIGYDELEIPEVATGPGETRDLGDIVLTGRPLELEGIVATAERSPVVVLPDRTVYSTRDMPVVQGGTATDALRTIPELEVDVEGKLTSRGAAPKVHLNGRPLPMEGDALSAYLQNLPADRIDRVEVIPNPPARYEAEGQGGIVNIVMQEDADLGLSGSLSLNAGSASQAGGSARINYQQGWLTFFGGLSLARSAQEMENHDLRENFLLDPTTSIRQDGFSDVSSRFNSLDMTMEGRTSERGSAWLEGRLMRMSNDRDGVTTYLHLPAAAHPIDRYDRASLTEFGMEMASAGAGYRHIVQPGRHEYSVEARGNRNLNDNDIFSSRFIWEPDGEREAEPSEFTSSLGGETMRQGSLQADVSIPWTESGKFEVGFRGSLRDTDNDREVEIGGAPGSGVPVNSAFNHRELFRSAYISGERTFGPLGVQLGLRGEIADIRFSLRTLDERHENEYLNLFPSANVSYTLSEGRVVRFTYSRRQDRPSSWNMNPIDNSTDPFNRFHGNPYLEPRYTHSFTLESSWSGQLGTIRVSPYYRKTTNDWGQVKTVDEAGVSTVTFENLASMESYGSSVSANLQPTGRVGGFVNLSAYREVRDASNLSSDFSGASYLWSANSNLTFRFSPTLTSQTMLNYMPARTIPQGRTSSMVFTSIGLRQMVLDRKGAINLSVMDPFDLANFEFETEDRTHRQTGRSSFGTRRLVLSLSYNFGRPPQSSRRPSQPDEMMQPDQTGIR